MGIFDSLFGKRKKVESSETPVKWNIPISSNEEDYVRRCLEAEFQEEKEVRTFRSDAAFATVLTPLNSKEYAKAIKVGKQILPQFSDFDLAYTWLASAYRETNQIQNSKEILSEGLKKAKRKYFILTEMGETEWKSGNIDAALYWWSQALHCLSNNPLDYNAYLLLSYVAKGAGTEEVEKVLLARVDSLRGGHVRLDSQTAERLTTLVKSKKSEAMKKVLYGLHEKYLMVKPLLKEEVEIQKAKMEAKETKTKEEYPEITTNSIGMEFVKIPGGEFNMGSPPNEAGRSDLIPVHRVKISHVFYMGKYEVTQKQWRDVMGDIPSNFKGDNLPVEQVSWRDVQNFIKKLNEKEGTNKYRLPTEAEWEYAARAGTTTRYSFGDDESQLGDYAWYDANSSSVTHVVGQKKPNPWGLYDIHGNVGEWVQDVWHGDYNGAPTDGSSWEIGGGSDRVFRGGDWGDKARFCQPAGRYYLDPGARSINLGFRLLRSL